MGIEKKPWNKFYDSLPYSHTFYFPPITHQYSGTCLSFNSNKTVINNALETISLSHNTNYNRNIKNYVG